MIYLSIPFFILAGMFLVVGVQANAFPDKFQELHGRPPRGIVWTLGIVILVILIGVIIVEFFK